MIKMFFLSVSFFSFYAFSTLPHFVSSAFGAERATAEVGAVSGGSKRRLSAPLEPGEKRYAIATTDTAFKHLLSPEASNFDLLQSFLQTFVPAFHGDPITEIQPMPVAVPALRERGEKQTFMDLYVKTPRTHYIIEMQAKRHVMFDERALFYACSTYSRQLPQDRLVAGNPWYSELKPVIAIQILDYDSGRIREATAAGVSDSLVRRVEGHPMREGQFFKHYLLTDQPSGQVIDHLQMIQVELPRGRKLLERKADHKTFERIDWWLELFCFSEDYTPDRIGSLKGDGVAIPDFFERALNRLDRTIWTPAMQTEYDVDLTDRAAYASVLAVERSEGREEGVKAGALIGARALKALGTMTDAQIVAQLEGALTEAEVSSIVLS